MRSYRGLFLGLAGAMIVAFGAASVHAAGMHILSSHGGEATARGLAFTAKADSYEAFYHNPAGLAQLKGYHIGGSLQYGVNNVTFDRKNGIYRSCVEGEPCPALEDRKEADQSFGSATTNNVRIAPVLGFATDLDGKVPFTFGIGVISPDADRLRDYGDSPAKYMINNNELVQFNVELGIAYTLPVWEDRIHLGATFGNSYVTQTQQLSGSLDTSGLETASEDAALEFEAGETMTFSYMLGVLVEATDFLSIGVSYRAKTKSTATGDGKFTPSAEGSLSGLVGTDPINFDVELPIRLPDVLRVGIRYHREKFDFEIDYIRSFYSYFGDIELNLSNVWASDPTKQSFVDGIAEGLTSEPLAIEKGFSDTTAIGVGSSILVNDDLTVSAGFHYSESASNEKNIDAIFPDFETYALSTGCQYQMGDVKLLFAAMYLHTEAVETDTNKFTSINLADEIFPGNLVTSVGNGEYSSVNFEFELGAQYNF